MIELKYKTRNNSSPQGKAKVYFCCAEKDYALLDEISKEILEKQNCAIFYLEKNTVLSSEDEKDLLFQLSQMQLVVCPVTSNFLRDDCEALSREFMFAKKNNLPILPLMYENTLVSLFNQKCGDIQFLDKFQNDDTAISYDKKLTDLLGATLISDDTAEYIRKAFDAYIFLSYRKKDRQYANEVMKEIHKNDFAKSIAIWFDEFLVPGENFNDAIKKALNKSEYFALVVTPHLLENNNYVMTTEYPMAKKENKKIMPIETVETDKTELEEKYSNIPNVVNVSDANALSKLLLDNIKNIATKKSKSVEHNFCIALAYLYGVDVEVNREYAFELLEECAKEKYEPAIRYLSSFYKEGYYVSQDLNKSIKYAQDLLKINEKQQDTLQGKEIYLSNLVELAFLQNQVYNFDEAVRLQKKVIKLLKENADIKNRDYVLIKETVELSSYYINQRDFNKAEKCLLTAVEDSKKYKRKDKGYLLATTYNRLGVFYKNLKSRYGFCAQLEEDMMKNAYKLRKELASSGTDMDLTRFAIASDNLAEIYREQGMYEIAKDYSKDAVAIFKDLSSKSTSGLYHYGISLDNYYQILLNEQQPCLDIKLEALDIFSKLVSLNAEAYIYDYALCVTGYVHNPEIIHGNMDKAYTIIDDLLTKLKELSNKQNSLFYGYCEHLKKFAHYYVSCGHPDKAMPLFETLKNETESKLDNIDNLENYSFAVLNIVNQTYKKEQILDIKALEKLTDLWANVDRKFEQLATHHLYAFVHFCSNISKECDADFSHIYETAKKYIEPITEPYASSDRAKIYRDLVNYAKTAPEGLDYLQKSYESFNVSKSVIRDDYENLGDLAYELGMIYGEQYEDDKAIEYLKTAFDSYRTICTFQDRYKYFSKFENAYAALRQLLNEHDRLREMSKIDDIYDELDY